MEAVAEKAGAATCPECGQVCADQRGLRGHLRFGHGMSTEEIRETVGQPARQQQERTQEQQPVPEAEASEALVLHESSNSGAPARTDELPGDLRQLQQLLQEVRNYKRQARQMMDERGLFEDDEADRNLVRLWELREKRITRKIVEIGADEGLEEEPSFLQQLFGSFEDDGEEDEW